MNNIFTALNLGVVGFIIVAGATKADWNNWSISSADVYTLLIKLYPPEYNNFFLLKLPTNRTYPNFNSSTLCNSTTTCGTGGFLPFGVTGMLVLCHLVKWMLKHGINNFLSSSKLEG
jgi:hypothetical protein